MKTPIEMMHTMEILNKKMMKSASNEPTDSDFDYQAELLQDVSRTFALTIPQLPHPPRNSYGNTYLLCRITDTIEDEPTLSLAQKKTFFERFVKVVADREDPESFAREFAAVLSSSTTASERNLVANTARVIRVTRGLNTNQRSAIERCIKIMSRGMMEFQRRGTSKCLNDLPHLDHYCYHVAGVVGETKTELFCDYSPKMAERREELLELSVSFGKGLQITNILKDVWGDSQQGSCWLPRDIFLAAGYDLDALSTGKIEPGFVKGVFELITVAHHHLARTLRYITLIPRRDVGIRLYCLWTLGLALLTLRRIHTTPEFRNAEEVEPSRHSILAMIVVTKIFVCSNLALKFFFWMLAHGLPNTGAKHLEQA